MDRQAAIRPIALGRKNWLFCWTEVGTRYVDVIHSLIATCRLHGIAPYTYLVDVLQRIDTHPADRVQELTPRLWKEHFAANAVRSDLDSARVTPLADRLRSRGAADGTKLIGGDFTS